MALGTGTFLSSVHHFLSTGGWVPMLISGVYTLAVVWQWADTYLLEDRAGWEDLSMKDSLIMGMYVFILTEVVFFGGLFWSWFNHSWSPSPQVSSACMHKDMEKIYKWGIPLLNTALLLSSSLTLTISHKKIISNAHSGGKAYLMLTLLMSITFLGLQFVEYKNSGITINEGAYGSLFFLLTGFHGLHVFIGAVFLSINLGMMLVGEFNQGKHLFYMMSIYYYHFVDIVWLLLFWFVY